MSEWSPLPDACGRCGETIYSRTLYAPEPRAGKIDRHLFRHGGEGGAVIEWQYAPEAKAFVCGIAEVNAASERDPLAFLGGWERFWEVYLHDGAAALSAGV